MKISIDFIMIIKYFIILAALRRSMLQVGEAHLRVIAPARNTASFEEMLERGGKPLATLCSVWPAEIWTLDLPLQRSTRCRLALTKNRDPHNKYT